MGEDILAGVLREAGEIDTKVGSLQTTEAAELVTLNTINSTLLSISGTQDGVAKDATLLLTNTAIGTTNTTLNTTNSNLSNTNSILLSISGLENTISTTLTNISGYVDGLETLVTTANSILNTISGEIGHTNPSTNNYYANGTTVPVSTIYVQHTLGFTSIGLMICNDESNTLVYSYDGVNTAGEVLGSEKHTYDNIAQSNIYLKFLVSGGDYRLKAW